MGGGGAVAYLAAGRVEDRLNPALDFRRKRSGAAEAGADAAAEQRLRGVANSVRRRPNLELDL